MIETTKLATLANVLSTTSAVEISRKELIATSSAAGLEERDCYFVLKPVAKGSKRGLYDIRAMLDIANTALAKRNDFTETAKVLDAIYNHEEVPEPQDENEESTSSDGEFTYFAPADEDEDEEIYEFEAVEPSDEDIADELSLMGTL
jgi:hypothetical protein